VARYLRISPDRVREMIARGELGAIDTAPRRCGRPRFVILPHHLVEWEQRHRAATRPPTLRRRRRTVPVDYLADVPDTPEEVPS
jgi:hypothetical protein